MALSAIGSSFLIALLALYVLALLAIGRRSAKKITSADDYLLAGRSVPLGLSTLSLLGTWFGSSAILGATRNTYELGLSGNILEPFACAATLAFTGLVFAGPLWRRQVATVADLFRERMGTSAEWISCWIQVPTFFCWIGAQYLSIGALLETYLGIETWIGVAASSIFVLLILWSGGMWAVTWTNSFLVALSITSVVILLLGTASTLGQGNVLTGIRAVYEQTPRDQLSIFPEMRWSSILGVVGVFLTGLLGNVPGQDLQQRVLSSRSPKVAKWSCVIASVLYLAVGLIPIFVGLAARLHLSDHISQDDVNGDRVLPIAASYFLSEPFVILLIVGLISVNLAVATSSTISQTTILSNNILGRWQPNRVGNAFREKGCMIAVSLGALAAAFSGESVMGLLEISLVIVMVALFVPMCMCLFVPSIAPWSGVASMLVGVLVWGCHIAAEKWLGSDPRSSFLQGFLAVPAEIQGLLASFLAAAIVQIYASKTQRCID
jgi:SSS family solute:Na+ symporter